MLESTSDDVNCRDSRTQSSGRRRIEDSFEPAHIRGIPTARSVDHVGFTVPDLDQAVDFFTRVLGCDLLYSTGLACDSTGGDWMARHFGVDAGASLRTAMLRCGPSANIELLAWHLPDAHNTMREEPGILAGHLAIYVNDLEAAAAYLTAERGVRVLGPPTAVSGEPNEGMQFVYTVLPWGMCLELVKWPPLMPYCAKTAVRLARPAVGWALAKSEVEDRRDR